MKRAALALLLLCGAAALALDWREVAAVRIPAGEVASVSVDGETVWKRVPYDAEIEYLESTGTQYVDTGVLPSRDLAFSCRFMCVNINTGYGNVFGARYSSGQREYILSAWGNGFAVVGADRKSAIGITPGNICDVSYDGSSTLTIDGTQMTMSTAENFADVGTILAFGIRNGGSPAQLAATRIYGLSLGAVRDLVPVRVGTAGYLYDRVSGQLFGNMGTGAFVLGPDK